MLSGVEHPLYFERSQDPLGFIFSATDRGLDRWRRQSSRRNISTKPGAPKAGDRPESDSAETSCRSVRRHSLITSLIITRVAGAVAYARLDSEANGRSGWQHRLKGRNYSGWCSSQNGSWKQDQKKATVSVRLINVNNLAWLLEGQYRGIPQRTTDPKRHNFIASECTDWDSVHLGEGRAPSIFGSGGSLFFPRKRPTIVPFFEDVGINGFLGLRHVWRRATHRAWYPARKVVTIRPGAARHGRA